MVRTTTGDRIDDRFYEHQDDAVLAQVNPVSGTLYNVLTTTRARIIGACARITWPANQPTPLQLHITVDGAALSCYQVNPVSTTWYYWTFDSEMALAYFFDANDPMYMRAFLLEGKDIQIDAEITWPGPAQPTPLEARIIWARYV